MERKKFILYNVLNQETVFEEYFCNLLQINDFRNAFLSYIKTKNPILQEEDIQYKYFNTEVVLTGKEQNYGRADILLKIRNKEFIFEIKNKEYTQLTENQPENYLNYLDQLGMPNEHLFFLIPKNYSHKEEIAIRWKNYTDVNKQLLYWEEFIKYLLVQKVDLIETNYHVKDFYDFCLYWFNIYPIRFSEKELSIIKGQHMELKDISLPEIMEKLEELVARIGKNSGLKQSVSEVGFYYDKIIKNDFHVSCGLAYDVWKSNNIPINIFIQSIKSDYEEFSIPNIKNIELEAFIHDETSFASKQFSFIVKQNFTIDDTYYEEKMEDLIKSIIESLSTI